jgi:hypothetical protein
MNMSVLLNNFISGEMSPLISARTDTTAYNLGARRLENFLVMPTGGLRKRPGTWFAGFTKNNWRSRLIDFPLSDGSCLAVELSGGSARFWMDKTVIQELTVPFTTYEAVCRVMYAVSKDTLWLVHPDYPPQTVTWDGEDLSLAAPSFTGIDFTAEGNRPGAVAFLAGRLVFAATRNNPNGIWLSMAPDAAAGTDRYTDFTLTTEDLPLASNAIYIEESDMSGSRIAWIASNRLLLTGTNRATWSDTGEIPTPATFDMRIVEYAGSAPLQGKGTREALVYAGRNGKSLRALVYNATAQGSGYVDMEISEGAAHLLTPGIRDFCVVDYPAPMAWIALNDGTLLSCTLNIRMGIIAFARHPMQGSVEALAAIPDAAADEVWLIVNRNNKRYVEYLAFDDVVGTPYEESHFVDCGKRIQLDTPAKTVPGLEHLAGFTVSGMGDGSVLPQKPVDSGGSVTYDRAVQLVHIGLPYASALVPTNPQLPANGSSLGKKRRLEKATLRIYASFGGKCGVSEDKLEALPYMRYGEYVLDTPPQPFTGNQELTLSGGIDPEGLMLLVHGEPAPFTLLALTERWAIMEV